MTIVMRPTCWHPNFGPNGLSAPAQGLCLNVFSSITADFNIFSAIRWAIQDQWSSGYLFGPHFDLYQSLNRLPIWNSQNCSMFPLAFVAGWLQGHLWGFISRNYVVWPTFLLMNVFTALKGSHFWFLFDFTAAGVVPCGGRKTSPRTSTIVQFIFYFGPLRSAIIFWEIRNKWLV